MPISLPYRELDLKVHAGGFMTTVAEINVDGETIRTLPRDFQLHPVADRPLHVDFLRLAAGSTITVDVPVHFVNEAASPGINRGGVLNVVRHRVELECPADAIPDHIVADLTGLDINDSLHISTITPARGRQADDRAQLHGRHRRRAGRRQGRDPGGRGSRCGSRRSPRGRRGGCGRS